MPLLLLLASLVGFSNAARWTATGSGNGSGEDQFITEDDFEGSTWSTDCRDESNTYEESEWESDTAQFSLAVADIAAYPGYTGDIAPTGNVLMSANVDDHQELYVMWYLEDMPAESFGGIHVHVGTTCIDADMVGGHYYDADYLMVQPTAYVNSMSLGMDDPWNNKNWYSNDYEVSWGAFKITTGYTWEENIGHAVVIHDTEGNRVACGLIGNAAETETDMGVYPGYDAEDGITVTGTVTTAEEYSGSEALRVTYLMTGLEESTYGGLHIHVGTTCLEEDMVGGHYYTTEEDPWTTYWYSDENGNGYGSFVIDSGYAFKENVGHAMVVHSYDGARIGCGLIGDQGESPSEIGLYPGSSTTITVTGHVMVAEEEQDEVGLRLSYLMEGLEESTEGGLHIHEGFTCLDADMVGGHYYDPDGMGSGSGGDEDPWTTMWESDETGVGYGEFTIDSGVPYEDNVGHAMVVHDASGSRIGCGLIGEGEETIGMTGTYPGYDEEDGLDVTGVFTVAEEFAGSDTLRLSYLLEGLEESTEGGLHIHTGTTCLEESMVGGHYYTTNEDPWTTMWGSDEDGEGYSSFTIDSGYPFNENVGHAMVVHSADGARIGCGLIGSQEETLTVIEAYPGEELTVTGFVAVAEETAGSTSLRVTYLLDGLDVSTTGGLHIHVGTTCIDADMVGGHYYETDEDPWTTTWESDDTGVGSGSFTIDSGFAFEANVGHAMVVHNAAGSRIGCGLIGMMEETDTTIGSYPGYDGDIQVDGKVAVAEETAESGSLRLTYLLNGLEASTVGGLHIHTGVTCLDADMVGGHYYYDMDEDPWTTMWESDEDGIGAGSFTIESGYSFDENLGHAIVVHDAAGNRIGCGLISNPAETIGEVSIYPGYDEEDGLDVTGTFTVAEMDMGTVEGLRVAYLFEGLEESTSGGLHIHTGTTCLEATMVGGHYYDTTSDPWVTTWSSDEDGNGSGYFTIYSGYDFDENVGHAMVIHSADGARIGCGLIGSQEEMLTVIEEYPGDELTVTGFVAVAESESGSGGLRLTYLLDGVETSTTGGLHIHVGTTCLDADMVGGHYYTDMDEDPWTTTWESDSSGVASGSFDITSGYDFDENVGHAVVVHNNAGSRVGCGLIGMQFEMKSAVSTYPDYDSTAEDGLTITGVVTTAEEVEGADSLRVSYLLYGLDPSTTGGLHIHTGTTCLDATMVGGHYYDNDMDGGDPWTTTWESDEDGTGYGSFTIDSGINMENNIGHAMVVHDMNGLRAGCGLIGNAGESLATIKIYPEYTGDVLVEGMVIVGETSEGSGDLRVSYMLDGLEIDTSGGLHIHTGTTCLDPTIISGHYYTTDEDPWTTTWASGDDGEGASNFVIDSGILYEDNIGHAVVIHSADGTRVACGLIGDQQESMASMGAYPGYYSKTIAVSGNVIVAEAESGAVDLRVTYVLGGLESDVTGGLHIHTGMDCDDADTVGGHYYDADAYAEDPWTTTYTSGGDGEAGGEFIIATGYDFEMNMGHAVVVHDSTGARVGCGVIPSIEITITEDVDDMQDSVIEKYESLDGESVGIGFAIGFFTAVLLACMYHLVKKCCCKKDNTKYKSVNEGRDMGKNYQTTDYV